ncbi:hypothetical protein L1987_48246 [Smallanthus sonchifolius]|uniref:Uncharacterized protein n=1 Tax=Smallanthus sonchifolius TaxID=185202 RepID=A0ACB9FSC0_9ASTR|nr:hypothetical protein L1987_48246 [Smallanthus sonchifolius]
MPRGPRIDVSYWEWLCQVVQMWRVEEDLPATCDSVGLTCESQPVPLIGECAECTIPLLVSRTSKHGTEIDLLEMNVKSIRRDLATLPTLVENVNGMAEDQKLIDQSLQHASSHMMEFEKRLAEMERRTAAAERRAEVAEQRAIDAELRATLAEARVEQMLTSATVPTGTLAYF